MRTMGAHTRSSRAPGGARQSRPQQLATLSESVVPRAASFLTSYTNAAPITYVRCLFPGLVHTN